MKKVLLTTLTVFSVFIIACNSDSGSGIEVQTGSIHGTVTINGMGDGANAIIVAERTINGETATVIGTTSRNYRAVSEVAENSIFTTVSSSDGSYCFDELPVGIYTVTASKEHTLGAKITNVAVRGTLTRAVTVLDIVLTATGTISGQVTLDGATTGLAGTFVYAEGTSYIAGTDDTGSFTLSDIPIGTYNILVYHNGYATAAQANIAVTAAADTPIGIIDLQVGHEITSFIFEASKNTALSADVIGTVTGTDVAVTVPYLTDVTALVPTIETNGIFLMVEGETQFNGTSVHDFTNPVTYHVVGVGSYVEEYTVTVTVALNPAKDITHFSFQSVNNPLLAVDVTGVITGTDIAATVPYDYDLTADDLVATFSSTGDSIEVGGVPQVSGTTLNTYDAPIIFTVTAEDGTSQDYTVTVVNELSPEKEMTEFKFEVMNNPVLTEEAVGVMAGNEITVIVPQGVDVTTLVATYTSSGNSIEVTGTPQVNGITANDFTSPVVYNVIAEDGTFQSYNINVFPRGWTYNYVPGKKATMVWFSLSSTSDGIKMAAQTSNGYIYTSDDRGATWLERRSIGTASWRYVRYSADGSHLYAKRLGRIFRSTDDGENWTEVFTGVSQYAEYIPRIAVSADGLKVTFVDGDNSIHTTSDGGDTWTELTAAGTKNWLLLAASSDGMKIAAAEQEGYLYTSDDGGFTWTEQVGAGAKVWRLLESSADGTKLVAAARQSSSVNEGYIIISEDSGVSWSEQTSAGFKIWASIAMSPDGMFMSAVGSGRIHKSVDGGYNWSQLSTLSQNEYTAITISDDGEVISVSVGTIVSIFTPSTYGYIYSSSNGGASWSVRTGAGRIPWNRLAISEDGQHMVGTGDNCCIHVSSDKGETWTARTSLWRSNYSGLVISSDGNRIVASQKNGYVYTSTDNGVTWTPQTAAGVHDWGELVSSLDCMTLATIIGSYIYTSTDGGISWVRRSSLGSGAWRSVAISSDGLRLVAVLNSSFAYQSNNGGATWTQLSAGGKKDWVQIVSSGDGNTLAAELISGKIIISTDSGNSWTDSSVTGSNLTISSDGLRFAVISSKKVLMSFDSGTTWTEQTALGNRTWTCLSASGDGTIFGAFEFKSAGIYLFK